MAVDFVHALEERRLEERDLNDDADMTVDKWVRYNKQNNEFSLTDILALIFEATSQQCHNKQEC
jgi:hypothetical protein